MLKQVSHFLIDPLAASGCAAGRGRRRTPATELRFGGGQLLADFGYRTQYRLRQFLQDVKLAELVWHIPENLRNRLGIQRRTVGRDALKRQSALVECRLKRAEETFDVGACGIVIQNLVADSPERVVVDDREDTKWAVVQFVGRDVSGELSQHGVEVLSGDVLLCLFSPRTPPSSGWWKKGQRRGGLSRDANWPLGMAARPPPPVVPPMR
jgi:hypothetical protein